MPTYPSAFSCMLVSLRCPFKRQLARRSRLLALAVVAERPVAQRQGLLYAFLQFAAIGEAGLGGEGEGLQLGAGSDGGADAHQVHLPVHGGRLVEYTCELTSLW